jgi:hypothetical protein
VLRVEARSKEIGKSSAIVLARFPTRPSGYPAQSGLTSDTDLIAIRRRADVKVLVLDVGFPSKAFSR